MNILKKFDGVTFNDVLVSHPNGVEKEQKRRYRIQKLPNHLILCLSRFKRNLFNNEKNQTIVPFPVKNLDLTRYVFSDNKSLLKAPSEEEIRNMSVSFVNVCVISFNLCLIYLIKYVQIRSKN